MRQQLVNQQNMTTANVLILKKNSVRQSEEEMTLFSESKKTNLISKENIFLYSVALNQQEQDKTNLYFKEIIMSHGYDVFDPLIHQD